MTKNVLVYIKGVQADFDGEAIETICPGTYYFKDGKHYIFYEEQQEGFTETSKCQLRLQKNACLEVIKKGLSNMHLVLDKRKKTSTTYATPYGQFLLDIDTKLLEVRESEQEICIRAKYNMEADGSLITRSEIEIRVKEI